MTTKEKLELIERVLQANPNTFTEDTKLDAVPTWDSLTILSLLVELTALKPDVQFDNLYACETVGDICGMI